MLINPLSDGHIHTPYCHHAVGEMEEYVVSAIDKGLQEIYFLEHMEEDVSWSHVTWLTEDDFDQYFAEGRRLKAKYSTRIKIGLGVEVGFNPHCTDKLRSRIAKRDWDRIGISLHFLKRSSHSKHINLVSKRDPVLLQLSMAEAKEIEEIYYHYLAEAVTSLDCDVLCHIDAILRYHPLRQQWDPPWESIDKLLDKVKKRGMAIEINTSGIPIRGEIFPGREILKRIMAKQIPLVAGSDAHKPEDVGYGFTSLNTYLQQLVAK